MAPCARGKGFLLLSLLCSLSRMAETQETHMEGVLKTVLDFLAPEK